MGVLLSTSMVDGLEKPPDHAQRIERRATVPDEAADQHDEQDKRHGRTDVHEPACVAEKRLVQGEPHVLHAASQHGLMRFPQMLEFEAVCRRRNDHHRRQDSRIILDQDRSQKYVHGDLLDPLQAGQPPPKQFRIGHVSSEAWDSEADSSGHGVNQLQNAGERRNAHLLAVCGQQVL